MTTAVPTSYAAPEPPHHHEPLKVADDTYLIRVLSGEGTAPVAFYLNSMVILGREPVIVDTGQVNNRRLWLEDVFSLVEPKDVRWVFISHDDHDHTGNLGEVLVMCPNATLISSWFQVERLSGDFNLPLDRMRWVNDGEAFDAGDRLLVAVRPPIFDSPTTRGLYDSKSRVYWAGDSFATPVLQPTDNVADLDPEFWAQGFTMAHSLISPWHAMLDQRKFNRQVDRIAELDLSAVASAHAPITSGKQIDEALAMFRTLPSVELAPLPGQAELEAILASMSGAA